MNETIKISVIVPIYNVEKYLDRCIESILKQTFTDIELILVDDGSPDNCPAMCDEWAKKDNRIVVVHKKNEGSARARNKGIELAQGEYLAFCDSDDYIDSNMYEILYNNAKKYNSDISMCGIAYAYDSRIVKQDFDYKEFYANNEEIKTILKRIYDESFNGIPGPTNKLYRRSMVIKNNIMFDETMIIGEDFWFNFGCLKVAQSLSFINECLYFYYQNADSIMHNIDNNSYEHWVINRKRLIEENEKLNFDIDYNKFYKNFIYKVIVFCRQKVATDKNMVFEVLKDEFFLNAIKYDSLLPLHIKFICFLVKIKAYFIIEAILKIWRKI